MRSSELHIGRVYAVPVAPGPWCRHAVRARVMTRGPGARVLVILPDGLPESPGREPQPCGSLVWVEATSLLCDWSEWPARAEAARGDMVAAVASVVAAGASVVALDRSAERLKLLSANLQRLGLHADVVVADAALKRAPAVLLSSRTLSGGKLLVVLAGGVAEVEEAMAAGKLAAGAQMVMASAAAFAPFFKHTSQAVNFLMVLSDQRLFVQRGQFHQQPGHGQHILTIVNQDIGQQRFLPRLQEAKKTLRHHRAGEIIVAYRAKHFTFQP